VDELIGRVKALRNAMDGNAGADLKKSLLLNHYKNSTTVGKSLSCNLKTCTEVMW
jgi:hypothetical protein